MKREDAQDALTRLYLYQTMGLTGRNTLNYKRVMANFDKNTDTEIFNLLNYITEHPMSKGAPLRDLYHLEARHRNIDAWRERDKIPLSDEEPYSVNMLLN